MKKFIVLLYCILCAAIIPALALGFPGSPISDSSGGSTNASDLSSGTVATARGGWGLDISGWTTGFPYFNSGTPTLDNAGTHISRIWSGSGAYLKYDGTRGDPSGTGDVVGPASAVDGELALFDNTTGKLIKRATLTGILKATSGVLAAASAGTDYLAPDNVTPTVLNYVKGLTSDAQAQINGKQASLGFTAENVANKGTDNALGTSDTVYSSQKAVKQYVDTVAAAKQDIVAFLTWVLANCTNVDNTIVCGVAPDGTRGAYFSANSSASCAAGDNAIKFISSDNSFRFCKGGVLYTPLDNASGAWIGGSTSALNFATTGTITGAISILDNVTGPTAAQSYGTLNVMTASGTVLLPTAVAGMSMCVQDGAATASDLIVDVQAGDNVVLVGVTQAGGVGITNASGTSLGDYVCLIATAANKWRVFGKQGTWASQ